MARIIGIDDMNHQQLADALAAGGRFVVFQYTISIVVLTFKRPSSIHFVPAGASAVSRGLGFTIVTALLGWWGIPWGPIYSIQALHNNLRGGKDVTDAVRQSIGVA